MRDVDRQNPVGRQENLAAEPLPVDEAGLETGDEQNIATPLRDTEDMEPDTRPDAMRDIEPDTVPDAMPDAMPAAPVDHDAPLFADVDAERLRGRWRELQADFVDDPQRAVREADDVVDEVMRTIAERRERLAGEWQGHTDTEHLRLALREYRSFFDRLLPT